MAENFEFPWIVTYYEDSAKDLKDLMTGMLTERIVSSSITILFDCSQNVSK